MEVEGTISIVPVHADRVQVVRAEVGGRNEQMEGLSLEVSSWVLVEHACSPRISSASSQASSCFISSAEFTSPEVLEPVLGHIAEFLVSAGQGRVSWKWIGMMVCTCKVVLESRSALVLAGLRVAGLTGDVRGLSLVIRQSWTVETGVYQAGIQHLIGIMSKLEELQGERFERLEDAEDDEMFRIVSWENGSASVISAMKQASLCSIFCVRIVKYRAQSSFFVCT